MSHRPLRSSARKPANPAQVGSSSDSSSDSENEGDSYTTSRRSKRHSGTRDSKSYRNWSQGKGKVKRNKVLVEFEPPPTPGSHPSEEDDDMEATPMFVSPYLDEGPPPTPGYSGFDTVRVGAPVPSFVSNSLTLMTNRFGINIDQPPPTPCPVTHLEDDDRMNPLMMNPTSTSRMLSSNIHGKMASSNPYPSKPSTSAHTTSKKYSLSMSKTISLHGKSRKKMDYRSGITFAMEEMVHNSILYFLIMQHKKLPVKKVDVVKHAMNGQTKDFKQLVENLTLVLLDVFGINLIELSGLSSGTKAAPSPSYILVSRYCMALSDSVAYLPPEIHIRRTILFLILSCSFMLNRSLEEEVVWKIMTELELNIEVGVRKIEDLRRFLKSEYVMPMYLKIEESRNIEATAVRYSWGLRAVKEFSKYGILKFVAKQFPGKRVSDYIIQYGLAMKADKEAVEKDLAEAAAKAERGEGEYIAPIDIDALLAEDKDFIMLSSDDDGNQKEKSKWKGNKKTTRVETSQAKIKQPTSSEDSDDSIKIVGSVPGIDITVSDEEAEEEDDDEDDKEDDDEDDKEDDDEDDKEDDDKDDKEDDDEDDKEDDDEDDKEDDDEDDKEDDDEEEGLPQPVLRGSVTKRNTVKDAGPTCMLRSTVKRPHIVVDEYDDGEEDEELKELFSCSQRGIDDDTASNSANNGSDSEDRMDFGVETEEPLDIGPLSPVL